MSSKNWLKDRVAVAKSGFSEIEKAVVKATNHDICPPKEKHVRNIIRWCEGGGDDLKIGIPEIVNMIGRRLRESSWTVVLKALQVFHRVIKEGPANFLDEVSAQVLIFNLKTFKDDSTPEAWDQSQFVVSYGAYVEEKLYVYRDLGYEVEREKSESRMRTMPVTEAFHALPLLQRQLQALLDLTPLVTATVVNNEATRAAVNLLLNDCFKLYRSLNDGVLHVLEGFFQFDQFQATQGLEVYRRFTRQTDAVITLLNTSKSLLPRSHDAMPELHSAPTDLIPALEEYVAELAAGGEPGGGSAAQGRIASGISSSVERSSGVARMSEFDRLDRATMRREEDSSSQISHLSGESGPSLLTREQNALAAQASTMGFSLDACIASLLNRPTNDLNVLLDHLQEEDASAAGSSAAGVAAPATTAQSSSSLASSAASDPFAAPTSVPSPARQGMRTSVSTNNVDTLGDPFAVAVATVSSPAPKPPGPETELMGPGGFDPFAPGGGGRAAAPAAPAAASYSATGVETLVPEPAAGVQQSRSSGNLSPALAQGNPFAAPSLQQQQQQQMMMMMRTGGGGGGGGGGAMMMGPGAGAAPMGSPMMMGGMQNQNMVGGARGSIGTMNNNNINGNNFAAQSNPFASPAGVSGVSGAGSAKAAAPASPGGRPVDEFAGLLDTMRSSVSGPSSTPANKAPSNDPFASPVGQPKQQQQQQQVDPFGSAPFPTPNAQNDPFA